MNSNRTLYAVAQMAERGYTVIEVAQFAKSPRVRSEFAEPAAEICA